MFIPFPHKHNTVYKSHAPDTYVKATDQRQSFLPFGLSLYESQWAGLTVPGFINRHKAGVTEVPKSINICMNMYVWKYTQRRCEGDATPETEHIPLPYTSESTICNRNVLCSDGHKNAALQNWMKTLHPRESNWNVVSQINTRGCKQRKETPTVWCAS